MVTLTKRGADVFDGLDGSSNPIAVSNAEAAVWAREMEDAIVADYNYIINGDFDIWQRGTSGFGHNVYSADMFKESTSTTDTLAISRQLHAVGQTDVPGNPTYFLRASLSAGSSGVNDFRQYIDFVNTFAGKTITLTYYIKGSTTATIVNRRILQVFGTGGSATTTTNLPTLNVTTSWQKVQDVIAVPSISGKTIGTVGTDYLDMIFSLPVNQTVDIDISHISICDGDASNEVDPFPFRRWDQELTLCQRYLCKTFPYSTVPASSAALNGALNLGHVPASVPASIGSLGWDFPVPMRTAPTVTMYAPLIAGSGFRESGGTLVPTTAAYASERAVNFYNTNIGPAAISRFDIHALATAER